MERIDKFIGNIGYGSRKDIAKYIKDELITINWELVKKPNEKVDFGDMVWIGEEEIEVLDKLYVILNKAPGYLSWRKEEWGYQTYLELLEDCPYANLLNPVGRLDQDTTGLLLLTNDWDLIHRLTSPKKDVFKTYRVQTREKLSEKDIKALEKWVKINTDKDPYLTKPSKVKVIEDDVIELSISEWKFHQVKKMLEAVSNKVISLHRVSIWNLKLDEDLEIWSWKYLTQEEVEGIY